MAVAITRAQLRTMDLGDFKKMPEKQQQQIMSRARKEFRRVAKSLSNSPHYSHALSRHLDVYGIPFEKYPKKARDIVIEYDNRKYNLSRTPDPRVMSVNAMLQELAAYQTFFNSKTSSVKGIKGVNYEQDKKLFGVIGDFDPKSEEYKTAVPKRVLTEDERKYLWSVFEEFNRQQFALAEPAIYGSDPVSQMIAEIVFETHATSTDELDFVSIIREVKNRIDAAEHKIDYDKWYKNYLFPYVEFEDGI